eukprot:gene9579-12811_t
MDGTLVLDGAGKLPFGIEPPGAIRYYEGRTLVNTKFVDALSSVVAHWEESEDVLDVHSNL